MNDNTKKSKGRVESIRTMRDWLQEHDVVERTLPAFAIVEGTAWVLALLDRVIEVAEQDKDSRKYPAIAAGAIIEELVHEVLSQRIAEVKQVAVVEAAGATKQ